jgi:hypothetical protein
MTRYYLVADHCFAIDAEPQFFDVLTNYAPFITTQSESLLFTLQVKITALPSTEGWEAVYTDRSDADMPRIEMYRRDRQWLFRVSMYRDSEAVCAMICSEDWSSVQLFTAESCVRFAVDNAAMLVYAFAAVSSMTLLFHASVIVRHQQAFLFLGHSGTGKSTHSRQWMTAFSDAELLNDDNPVLRILPDGAVRVYGSPWSGKTPCYKNKSALVGALVQLEQAPENAIAPLRMTQAYPYILSSVSGLKILPQMMDSLYVSIARLLELRQVYLLRCLPNPDAARLCARTCLS